MENQRMKKINILLTSAVIVVSVIALCMVFLPRVMGLKAYSIETGSMSPTIKQGSMIFVREYSEFSDYEVGDIVTFADVTESECFTHRIVKINAGEQTFITKGDANDVNDPMPTEFSYAVGKVELVIPIIGYGAAFLRYTAVKIAVVIISIAWLAIEIELILAERKKRHD